ncbi:MAG: hypothetical protein JNK56_17390, partial [Myxococcales bacterium]|nr:hypothetical protein [Myxococcales bacterium]
MAFGSLALGCGDSGGGSTSAGSSGELTGTGSSSVTAGPTEASTVTAETTDTPTSVGTGSATGSTTDTPPVTTGTSDATTGPGSTGPVSASEPGTTEAPQTTGAGSSSSGDTPCAEDTILCSDKTAQVCDGVGGFKSEEVCPDECVEGKGCVLCVPGASSCDGDKVLLCNDEGSALDPVETCDGVQGLSCDPNAGQCVGACAGL